MSEILEETASSMLWGRRSLQLRTFQLVS